jgi:hypothetical protein
MAASVIDLWRHPAHRLSLCERALALVRSRYSWSVAAERIAQSLGVVPIGGRRGNAPSGDERSFRSAAVPAPGTIR